MQKKTLITNNLEITLPETTSITVTVPRKSSDKVKEVKTSCSCSSVDIDNNFLNIKIKEQGRVIFFTDNEKYYTKNVNTTLVYEDGSTEDLTIKMYIHEKID